MAKKGISKVKRNTIKSGKLAKGKKNVSKSIKQARKHLQIAVRQKINRDKYGKGKTVNGTDHEVSADDVMDMLDSEELSGISFSNINRKLQTSDDEEENTFESYYESQRLKEEMRAKNTKFLLPIKTKKGMEWPTVNEENAYMASKPETSRTDVTEQINDSEEEKPNIGFVSAALIIAQRRKKLAEYKARIGILSASFLEDPENRLKNLESLIGMIGTVDHSLAFTVPKLACVSLAAVFQDVLPLYPIKHFNQEGSKQKMETRKLQGYETALLSRYKTFLQKLEKLVSKHIPRKRQSVKNAEFKLGKVALNCLCGMLITHPYFNYATNIVNFVIPFLNNWDSEVRRIVFDCLRTVFKNDKRGQITYEIVRRVNVLIKSKLGTHRQGVIRRDVVDCLLSLRIKAVDLEKEKKEEMTPKGKLTFEQRKMMSKKQRKKSKDMVKLEKELLEVSAEESKTQKSHYLTEVTKLVFTIYFRTLKSNPKSEILSSVLEGLSKFAHIINIDFFDDLLKVIEALLHTEGLHQRQVLLCISTVLSVLQGQGSVLTLDPSSFHKNLYKHLLSLNMGTNENVGLGLSCVRLAVGKQAMPNPRATAFVKRLATAALHVEHHEAAAILSEIKHIFKIHPATTTLLYCDGTSANGIYNPELEDPDHSCANASTLWEATCLMDHYHPWVRQMVKSIIDPEGSSSIPNQVVQRSPEDICQTFNPMETMDFIPTLPPRCPGNVKRVKTNSFALSESLENNLESYSNTSVNIHDLGNEINGLNFLPCNHKN